MLMSPCATFCGRVAFTGTDDGGADGGGGGGADAAVGAVDVSEGIVSEARSSPGSAR